MKKYYNNYYFTLKSSIFSPFNSMNLYIHFQQEKINNSFYGYYFLNTFENYKHSEDNYKLGNNSQPNFMNKKAFKAECIKKIAAA